MTNPKELVFARHVLAMKDDAYLSGHPEWEEIVKEAEQLLEEAPELEDGE